jgi:pyridoxal phosphate enzyme (YggS family)
MSEAWASDRVALADNLARVRQRMAAAAARAGRQVDEVTLVAVSKTQPAEAVVAGIAEGLRHLGENRVEEGNPKMEAVRTLLPPASAPPEWHMIGHIQSRKAEDVVAGRYALVHSVDSVKLARRLSRLCLEAGMVQDILLEINVSGEASKYGFTPDGLAAAVTEIVAQSGVRVRGLMTMAPIAADAEEARPIFAGLRNLRDAMAIHFPQVDWRHLSMGMTDDFEVAIEEGATIVRVGRAIFSR